jgi:hypothetical protein
VVLGQSWFLPGQRGAARAKDFILAPNFFMIIYIKSLKDNVMS